MSAHGTSEAAGSADNIDVCLECLGVMLSQLHAAYVEIYRLHVTLKPRSALRNSGKYFSCFINILLSYINSLRLEEDINLILKEVWQLLSL